ncbi:hypothetical protein L1887_10150 [Cichorium endivia]|nr:hypothetical protein L1887_10150 [Cichorium endivia]
MTSSSKKSSCPRPRFLSCVSHRFYTVADNNQRDPIIIICRHRENTEYNRSLKTHRLRNFQQRWVKLDQYLKKSIR